jgi:uncharacterized protein YbjT (DUF2867 family)
MRVILTGATGMVGEGVLLACLEDARVDKVLAVARRASGHTHPKLEEVVVADFSKLDAVREQLKGYDACFYCAGISSAGMSEADYTRVTYDTPLAFAKVLAELNPAMTLCHVSGASTDGTEQGRVMWARVKGKAENALMKLPFKGVYNFRPGLMTPMPGQKHVKTLFKVLLPVVTPLFRKMTLSLNQVEDAMVKVTLGGAKKQVLEVADIREVAGQ